MKLAISNIAWQPEDDSRIAESMLEYGFTGVEIAPTKLWKNPLEAEPSSVDSYRAFWNERGITIPSMQALLFGRPDLRIFDDKATRSATLAYLSGIIELGARLGARVLVFGSPKNRSIGNLDRKQAFDIAAEFFGAVGRVAAQHDSIFCIEPNPVAYGCDFVTTSEEGLELVHSVAHPGFGLHLDTAGMTMSKEKIGTALQNAFDDLCHFHISEPDLVPIGTDGVDHKLFSKVLSDLGYEHWYSVEMRSAEERQESVDGVRLALAEVCKSYKQST